ncbi:hypothetical protein NL676_036375 [Syzygium grande]|nr:hypothetical protein NL676_036375 [Syzygium grande]
MISVATVSDDLIDLNPVPYTHIPAWVDEEQQEVNVPNNARIPKHVETDDVVPKPKTPLDAPPDIPIRRSVRDQRPSTRYSTDEYVLVTDAAAFERTTSGNDGVIIDSGAELSYLVDSGSLASAVRDIDGTDESVQVPIDFFETCFEGVVNRTSRKSPRLLYDWNECSATLQYGISYLREIIVLEEDAL